MISNKLKGKALFVRFFLATSAFLFLTLLSQGQYLYNDRCKDAFQLILGLQFDKARLTLQEEKKANPSNLIPVYLENHIDFLTLFIGENRVQFDQLKVNKGNRIDKLENGSEDSPYYRFCLAEVNLQWAFARLKFGDYTSAALEIKKAHSLFTENNKKFPSFLPNKIGLGVVHVIAGIVPENYKWITNLIGVDGSMEQGLTELREVATYSGTDPLFLIYKQESSFYLGIIAANLQKNKKDALTIIDLFENQHPDSRTEQSPLVIFARANILMKNGLNDRALKVLQQRTSSPQDFPFYFLDYLEGLARLNQLDLEASSFFRRYVDNFKGMNYIKSAYQKLAWIALIQGDTVAYGNYSSLIEKKGSSLVDEDKQAQNEANIGIHPSVVLLRSRLLFDGGYYQRALAELLDNPVSSFVKNRRDLVEYTYRLARIYHETGSTAKAIDYYRQTIKRGSNEPYYYAAASAFQMGLIYENSGDYLRADSAYQKCLSIKTQEYKTSLNQKAKAGLNRVRKQIP